MLCNNMTVAAIYIIVTYNVILNSNPSFKYKAKNKRKRKSKKK